jgi:hypothetical protein
MIRLSRRFDHHYHMSGPRPVQRTRKLVFRMGGGLACKRPGAKNDPSTAALSRFLPYAGILPLVGL